MSPDSPDSPPANSRTLVGTVILVDREPQPSLGGQAPWSFGGLLPVGPAGRAIEAQLS